MMTQDQRALLYGFTAVAGWSTVATAFKLALSYMDPLQLVFFATLFSCTILLAITIIKGQLGRLWQCFLGHWQISLIGGLLNPVAYYLILFAAYNALPAQVAMSINYSWAIVLAVMAAIFLKQRLLLADYVASGVCYSGVLVIVTGGSFSAFTEINWMGISLALGSTIIWASYWTLNASDKREPVAGLTVNFLIALPITGIICAMTSGFSVSIEGIAAAGYIGLVEMGLGFVLWSTALRLASNASRVSNLIFLSPLVSLMLIATILDEAIEMSTLTGLALILSGLAGQQWAHRNSQKKAG